MSGSPRTAIGRTWWQATAPHALVWPDHRDRAARLNTAIRVALDSPERPVVHRGDATAELAAIIATIPAHAHLVLYHCAVLAHMPDTTQAAFTSGVLACSTDRPISWVQAEPRTDGDVRRLRLLTCHDGRVVHERALASYQPHGQWLTWTHLLWPRPFTHQAIVISDGRLRGRPRSPTRGLPGLPPRAEPATPAGTG